MSTNNPAMQHVTHPSKDTYNWPDHQTVWA